MSDLEPTAAHRDVLRVAATKGLKIKGAKVLAGSRSVTHLATEMLNAGWIAWYPEHGVYRPTDDGIAILQGATL